MSELTPEVRKDKRGHMVTRWVRGKASSSSKGSAIPAVKPSSEEKMKAHRERTINRLAKLYIVYGLTYDFEEAKGEFQETVGKYTNRRTFEVINEELKSNPSHVTDIEVIVSDYPEDTAREIIHFMNDVQEDLYHNQTQDRDALLSGLRDYGFFSGVSDTTTLKGDEHDLAVALVKIGSHILYFDRRLNQDEGIVRRHRWHIEDAELVEAVKNNLDRVDEITTLMSERSVFDGESVNRYLKEHSALSDGFL